MELDQSQVVASNSTSDVGRDMKSNLPRVPLISGERISMGFLKDVTHVCPVAGSISGKLVITNYKLYFYGLSVNDKSSQFSIETPLCTISHAEKVGGASAARSTDAKNPYGVDVFCKDMRVLRFLMRQENKQRKTVIEKLQESCFPASNKVPFFAYHYKEEFVGQFNGWDVYKPEEEFTRQGLPVDAWRITRINQQYELCETYPTTLVVPSSATDDDLRLAAQFRSRARIPVLSWIHPNHKATITRCAQPLTGISKRNKDDERYLQMILDTNPQCQKLLIYDARPQANAIANMARGGGYEKSEGYPTSELIFCDIHNIHVMRDSSKKLQDACLQLFSDDKHWFSNLDQSQWLHHAKIIIAAAIRIVDCVESNQTSVLVHCSDGWDRTAQLTGLAMIMLDSYYRTLEGFEVLIEKEWLSFGHKFAQRIGHGDKNHSDSERSPVFLQFIDCVWQITQQFPAAFEFNEHFLILILDHLYSCLFGNFLFNCDKERTNEDVRGKSKSLWSLVAVNREYYLNPLYVSTYQSRVILPIAAVRHLSFWSAYYLRWNSKLKPQVSVGQHHRELKLVRDHLKKKVMELESRLASEQPSTSLAPLLRLNEVQV